MYNENKWIKFMICIHLVYKQNKYKYGVQVQYVLFFTMLHQSCTNEPSPQTFFICLNFPFFSWMQSWLWQPLLPHTTRTCPVSLPTHLAIMSVEQVACQTVFDNMTDPLLNWTIPEPQLFLVSLHLYTALKFLFVL